MQDTPAPATIGSLGLSDVCESLESDRFEELLGPYTIARDSVNEGGRDMKLTLAPCEHQWYIQRQRDIYTQGLVKKRGKEQYGTQGQTSGGKKERGHYKYHLTVKALKIHSITRGRDMLNSGGWTVCSFVG